MSSAHDLDEVGAAPPAIPPPPCAQCTPKSASTPRPVAPRLLGGTDHSWAAQYPEVHQACWFGRICSVRPPLACRLLDIPSILQVGPTCGLTALSMLARGRPSTELLFAEAQRRGFTRNGEMFSARNLMLLAREALDGGGQRRVWLYRGELEADEEVAEAEEEAEAEEDADGEDGETGRAGQERLKEVLRQGGCLLVPYDSHNNHAPCLKKGHRAHWALVIGYLIDADEKWFVFVRHGKTRNIAAWPLDELSKSNAQLVEFAKPKLHQNEEFELPPGGVGGPLGLRRRCVVVERVGGDQQVPLRAGGAGVACIVIR